jgi:hypothetical protein
MAGTLKTIVAVEGYSKAKLMEIPSTLTIGGFLGVVRFRSGRRDLRFVWLSQALLSLHDLFSDWWCDDEIFFFTAREIPPSRDWVSSLIDRHDDIPTDI